MRRSEKQVKQPEEIMKILTAGTVCQLAFSAQPVPYLLTLNYAYHNGALYFHSANEGRKIDFLVQQPQAAFTVARNLGLITGDSGCRWTTRFQSVVGHGLIVLLETVAQKRCGLNIFMRHYSDEEFTFPDRALDNTTVFRLDIEHMTAKQSKIDE